MLSLWRETPALRITVYIVLALLALVIAPWVYLDWQTSRDLEAELQRIRDAGEPLTLDDVALEPVSPSQNAAELYQRVLGQMQVDSRSVGSSVFEMTGHSELIEQDYLQDRASDAAARAVLESRQVEKALKTLRQGAGREKSRFPHTVAVHGRLHFPHLFGVRSAARWLSAKSKLLANDDRIDEALDWCRVSLRMSEHVAQEPSVIAQLVAIAMQAIACDRAEATLSEGAPSPEFAREMATYLRTIDIRDEFAQALLAERAAQIVVFEQYRDDLEMARTLQEMIEERSDSHLERVLFWLYGTPLNGPVVNMDFLIYLETMREIIGMARTSNAPERKHRQQQFDQTIPGFALMTRVAASVSGRAIDKRDQSRVNVDLLEIALAAEIYRAGHGDWPPDLQTLRDALRYDLPEDPFAEDAYQYRRENGGYTLYSLGWDLDDDGGHGPKDPGYDWENFDIVWRVRR